MVSGDVVNGIGAVNTILNFQPAVNIEVCLTQALIYTHWTDLTDGANPQPIFQWHTTASNNPIPTKILINNTNYITMRADASYGGVYTGIQIK
tara:strand:- start:53 stop:331 length:279 start_codon:yes stop_codon:yes gene_type:complete